MEAAFEAAMGGTKLIMDPTVLAKLGYELSDPNNRPNVCLSCKQLAKTRGGRCCERYSQANRAKKHVILHMRLGPCAEDGAEMDDPLESG